MGTTMEVTKRLLLIVKLAIAFFLVAGVITLVAYTTGQWLPRYDLEITELGICESNLEFQPVAALSINAANFYICGKAVGTTFRNVIFYIFKDESAIYQQRVRLEPGIFYVALSTPEQKTRYSFGKYRIEASYERLIIFESAFEIR